MNRRQVLTSLIGVLGGAGLGALNSTRRYGPVTVERHARLREEGVHLHVFYQGREVTRRCRFADDTGEGMAELFLHDASGKAYWDPHTREIAKEFVCGVTFREGAPFA